MEYSFSVLTSVMWWFFFVDLSAPRRFIISIASKNIVYLLKTDTINKKIRYLSCHFYHACLHDECHEENLSGNVHIQWARETKML